MDSNIKKGVFLFKYDSHEIYVNIFYCETLWDLIFYLNEVFLV